MTIKFQNHEQVIDTLNSAELWLGIFKDVEDQFYSKFECFDDPSHLIVQLDYYCDHWFKPMLYNIRLRECIKWYLNNSKSIDDINNVINDALQGKTSYLVPPKQIEGDDEIPF